MSDAPFTWVISYDIVDDKRRTKAAKFLQSKGQRVQYSVFEVLATAEKLEAILKALQEPRRFDPETDSLRAWRLCANCQPLARVVGVGPPVNLPGRPLVL